MPPGSKARLSPESLFSWAYRFARRHEAADRGTVYPTLRQASRRFGVPMDEIESVADEGVEDGYLGIAVALGVQGVGYHPLKRSDMLVEAYK